MTTACVDCRDIADNRSWALQALGHPDCVTAIRAERIAARTFWIRINPHGCVVGSALGDYVGLLAEDAHKQFTPRVRDRRREASEGYRHELVTHAEWKQRAELCLLGRCEHRAAS
ncbi:hypothetical protein ACIQNU_03965 [Streptomyces sp. NPDC091292]|uniref:hypothetical protein n=1 Tax=Streptomyces sp. NPDC091292 TaxID=3365991 RepID=UPI0037F954A3